MVVGHRDLVVRPDFCRGRIRGTSVTDVVDAVSCVLSADKTSVTLVLPEAAALASVAAAPAEIKGKEK